MSDTLSAGCFIFMTAGITLASGRCQQFPSNFTGKELFCCILKKKLLQKFKDKKKKTINASEDILGYILEAPVQLKWRNGY